MDALQLLLTIVALMSTSEWRSDTVNSKCPDTSIEDFKLIEGESLYFVPYLESNHPDKSIMWIRDGSDTERITSDEEHRIHHCEALLFLNVTAADSGIYKAKKINSSDTCVVHQVNIDVFDEASRESVLYGGIKNSDQNKKIPCPDAVWDRCEMLKGNITWYKGERLIQGQHEASLWLFNAKKEDGGIYTCMCTWTHHHKTYKSSGSKRLTVLERGIYNEDVQILSPTDKEQLADEGLSIKLNCTVFCGINVKSHCDARWFVNIEPIEQLDGYNQTNKREIEEPSKNTISTAILTIEEVSAEDFQHEFKCLGVGLYTNSYSILTLKQRESVVPLVIGGVCVFLICVFVIVLIKCFAIDLALLFRPYFPSNKHKKGVSFYDAYVIYQTQNLDDDAEDKLSHFVTTTLPSVLEDKCGYRLFIQGRDDIPGEGRHFISVTGLSYRNNIDQVLSDQSDRVELVEKCLSQSRRLMVILTPGSGSDNCLVLNPTSASGGFEWQVGLHHALVQRQMSVILVQLGDTGPQGYTHLPPGLQHLIRQSAPIRWPEGSRGAASWNSRFWKRVRYLMPAAPARKHVSDVI